MAKKRHEPTFKDFLSEPTWSETDAPTNIRPGTFNFSGEFFDLSGNVLSRSQADVTPKVAQALVDDGAVVAFEGCGCGGGGGCAATWFTDDALDSVRGGPKPAYVKGYGSPTWIDVWTNDDTTVVYAHGDIEWGKLF